MTADYGHLEAVARAATKGPWVEWAGLDPDGTRRDGISPESDAEVDICETPCTPQGREDATHIATFDPPTVLGLIATIRKQAAAIQAAREVCDLADQGVFGRISTQRLNAVPVDNVREALDTHLQPGKDGA